MSDNALSAENQQGRLNEKLTPDYIVGLVDGEGYFSVSVGVDHSKDYLSRRVRLVFGVKLNAFDGKILYDLRDWFRCGEVRFRKDDRENFCDCLEYQVRDMEAIRKIIIPFFLKNPLKFPKKKSAFSLFVEIALQTAKGKHLSPKGFTEIKDLAHQMHHEFPQRLHARPPVKLG